ncbi:MAG: ABC transporter permease [Phycisphaerales bacterium]|nr:ABC transporter permease [Phycisphaerales bacterium]
MTNDLTTTSAIARSDGHWARTRRAVDRFGDFWIFAGQTAWWMLRGSLLPQNWRLLVPQLYEVGYRSLPVILITGAFVGMVLAVQAIEQFRAVGLEERMGAVVNLSVVRELGPVLAGIMLAGRIGGALTAELGTMSVTEQIDALRSMGVNPIRYLVAPRVLACFLLTPTLTLFADFTGALGGWFVSVIQSGIDSGPYWEYTREAVENFDLFSGILKGFFFGAALGLISCYKGFHCRAGAEGVGRACTEAFVTSFIAILILDYVLAVILQQISEHFWGFRSLL